ncbi:nuclease-related domain-containing protein [Microbacterium sp. STN6]|uniref:nuclease-related domain-containing protein n=1 Tax=Microbacterium sp. STN6 TaxID=2995588 RepID=UPI002260976D|nr:nuclease-related domain-containing protein [Microbacterium sp. STN6]MCX7521919.1 nuclease-related domain-containing protein [Microbacterium sp. STN6]
MDFESMVQAFRHETPVTPQADPKPRFTSAHGNSAVGAALSLLGDDWVAFRGMQFGPASSRLDHLALGPGGVFAIMSRRHPGRAIWVERSTFVVGGQRMPYVRTAEHDAARVQKLLADALPPAVRVTPLIVVVDPGTVCVREQPAEAVVLDARGLARWLRRRPQVLGAEDVARAAALAGRSAVRQRASAA